MCVCVAVAGLGMGPLLDMAVVINPQIIVTALIGTSVIFASFSIAALTAERGHWLYLGGSLMTLLSTMLMLSLANLLFGSKLIFQVSCQVIFYTPLPLRLLLKSHKLITHTVLYINAIFNSFGPLSPLNYVPKHIRCPPHFT